MENELKEVGLTFALGGLAFFGFWQIIRMIGISDRSPDQKGIFALIVDFISDKKRDKTQLDNQTIKQIAIVALIFGIGFMLEDFSKKLSAERDPEINSAFFNLLDTDKNLRLRSLFYDATNDNRCFFKRLFSTRLFSTNETDLYLGQKPIFMDLKGLTNCETTPDPQIAGHLFKICTTFGTNLFSLESTQLFRVSSNNASQFKSEVNLFYELARNRVVKEDTYQRELQEIYGRVTFSRSCVFLCLLLAAAFVCLMLAAFIALLTNVCLWLHRIIVIISVIILLIFLYFAALPWVILICIAIVSMVCSIASDMRGRLSCHFVTKGLMGIAICVAGFFLAQATFREEHGGMDSRVMGYYMTLCNDYSHEHIQEKSVCEHLVKSPELATK